jgi:aspartyl-tRNA synthetase
MKRTHTCGQLNEKHIGKQAVINGWVHRRRDHGGLIFIDVRDRYGLTQVVFHPEKGKKAYDAAQSLANEFVVAVRGKVHKRPKGTENKKISTGKIELNATELEILEKSKQPLPLEVSSRLPVGEDTRLKYRYLDLRRSEMRDNIITRHKIIKAIRDYCDKEGFVEVETPILAKSTPEGARDFLVPSRVQLGSFFALPQSPQLFKQILMVSGFDRYIQIARCFRDEDLRADRQLEFTQLDLEMSFVDEEDIYNVIEGCLAHVMKEVKKINIKRPFPRMTYEEAMNKFGSDKPDTRFGLELDDITKCFGKTGFDLFKSIIKDGGAVKALLVPKGSKSLDKTKLNKLTETAKIYGAKGLVTAKVGKGTFESMITKHLSKAEISHIIKETKAKPDDMLLVVAGDWNLACNVLGQVRLQAAEFLDLIDKTKFNFLWVTDFPMFEWDNDEQRPKAMHHPFTSPKEEDLPLLEKEPLKMKSRGYDVVVNGVEIGGGSIRIHRKDVQQRVFKALGISDKEAKSKFGFLLQAFDYGPPPHGGIALGLDRVVALLVGVDSIREVIAFPKNKAAQSLMDGAPGPVSGRQLKELGIMLDIQKPEEEKTA